MANGNDPLFRSFSTGTQDPDEEERTELQVTQTGGPGDDPLFRSFPAAEPETVEGGRLATMRARPPEGREPQEPEPPTTPEDPPSEPPALEGGRLATMRARPPEGREPTRGGPLAGLSPEQARALMHEEVAPERDASPATSPLGVPVRGRQARAEETVDEALEARKALMGHTEDRPQGAAGYGASLAASVPREIIASIPEVLAIGASGDPREAPSPGIMREEDFLRARAQEGREAPRERITEAGGLTRLPEELDMGRIVDVERSRRSKAMGELAEIIRGEPVPMPEDPRLAESWLLNNLIPGVASMLTFVGIGAAAGPMGAGLVAMTTGQARAWEEAKERGRTDEEARQDAIRGILPGVIQVTTPVMLLSRLQRMTGGTFRQQMTELGRTAGIGTVNEMIVNSSGEVGFNVIAERPLLENYWEAMRDGGAVAFVTAGLMGGPRIGYSRLRTRQYLEQTQESIEFLDRVLEVNIGPDGGPLTAEDRTELEHVRGMLGEIYTHHATQLGEEARESPVTPEEAPGPQPPAQPQEGAPAPEAAAEEAAPEAVPTPEAAPAEDVEGQVPMREDDQGRLVSPVQLRGRASEVVLADGRRMPVDYSIVDGSQALTSHDAVTFQPTEGFPEGIQDRRYHADRVAQEEVRERARQLDPSLVLDPTPLATNGPPILREDGIKLSGNQRNMLLQRAKELHPERFASYLEQVVDGAEGFGIGRDEAQAQVEAILAQGGIPEVARVLSGQQPTGRAELAELMAAFNDTATKSRDPIGLAQVMARRLRAASGAVNHFSSTIDPDQTIRSYLDTAAGRDFFWKLIQEGVIPRSEASEYLDARTDMPNSEGRNLIERLMLSSAVQDAETIDRAPAGWLQKIEKGVPAVLETQTVPGWDLTPILREALEVGATMRQTGHRTVEALVTQTDLAGREWSPEVERLARFIEQHGPNRVTQGLRHYARLAQEARQQSESEDLFGTPPASPRDAFESIFQVEGAPPLTGAAALEVGAPPQTVIAPPEELARIQSWGRSQEELEAEGQQFLQEIADLAEVQEARQRPQPGDPESTATQFPLGHPEREALRERWLNILDRFNGFRSLERMQDELGIEGTYQPARDRQLTIIMGPPAAGKSTLANPVVRDLRARLIDSDEAKALIPEFENGTNAGGVHEESSWIAQRLLGKAVERGENIVYATVGKTLRSEEGDGLLDTVDLFREAGYSVNVILNELPAPEAARRAFRRFQAQNRWVEPNYVINLVGNRPQENWADVRRYPGITSSQRWNNDVPRHDPPVLLEVNGITPDPLSPSRLAAQVRGRAPGSGGLAPAGVGGRTAEAPREGQARSPGELTAPLEVQGQISPEARQALMEEIAQDLYGLEWVEFINEAAPESTVELFEGALSQAEDAGEIAQIRETLDRFRDEIPPQELAQVQELFAEPEAAVQGDAPLEVQDDLLGGPPQLRGEEQRDMFGPEQQTLSGAEAQARNTLNTLGPLVQAKAASPPQLERYREALALLRRNELMDSEEVTVRSRQLERAEAEATDDLQQSMFELRPETRPPPPDIQDRNTLHPWQQTRDEFVGEETTGDLARFSRETWDTSVLEALSEGKLTVEEAEARGFDVDTYRADDLQELPRELWHVTTNVTGVLQIGLRTRAQLRREGARGLGGGPDSTISFTRSRETAEAIQEGLLLANRVMTGETSLQELFEQALKGEGADRPWVRQLVGDLTGRGFSPDMMQMFWNAEQKGEPIEMHFAESVAHQGERMAQLWRPGEPLPKGAAEALEEKYNTPEKVAAGRFDFLRRWLFWREQAGGPVDPYFQHEDPSFLQHLDPREIRILKVSPPEGALGYTSFTELDEIRSMSGRGYRVLEVDGGRPSEVLDSPWDRGWATEAIREVIEKRMGQKLPVREERTGDQVPLAPRAADLLPDSPAFAREGPEQTPPSISQIREDMANTLNIPIRTGRLRKLARAFGIYQVTPETVRVRMANDITAISHEVGHHMHKLLFTRAAASFNPRDPTAGLDPNVLRPWQRELLPMAEGVSGGGVAEGWAEYWRRWITNREVAERQAPRLTRWITDTLQQRDPALWDAVQRWQSWMEDHAAAAPWARTMSRLSFSEGRWARIWPKAQRGFERAYQEIMDRFIPLERAQRELEGLRPGDRIDSLTENVDQIPKIIADMIAGSGGVADHFLRRSPVNYRTGRPRDDVKSLEGALSPVRDNLEHFENYLVNKRAHHLQTEREIDQGFETRDLELSIDHYEQKHPEFVQAAEDVYAYQDALLDYVVEAGVITQETAELFREGNPSYVPLYKVKDPVMHGSGGTGTGKNDHIFSPFKRIGNSGRDIVSPVESIVKNTHFYTKLAAKQRLQASIASLAEVHGAGRWVSPIDEATVIQSKVSKKELTDWMRREVAKELGHERIDRQFMEQVGELLPELFLVMRPGDYFGKENVISHLQQVKDPKTGKTRMKRFWYEVDPDIYRALTHTPDAGQAGLVRILSMPARTLRVGATTALEFIGRNPFRDQTVAFVQSEYGYTPGVDLARGVFHILGKTDQYWAWKRSGGEFASLVDMDRNSVIESIRKIEQNGVVNVIKHPFGALQALAATMENATRMGEYLNTLRAGGEKKGMIQRWLDELDPQFREEARARMEDPDKELATLAGWNSREISVQYSTHGAADSIQIMRMLATFWNARIQGYSRLVRSFREDPAGASLRSFTSITLPALMLYAINREDDEYWEIPQWQRDWFYLVKVPNVMRGAIPEFMAQQGHEGFGGQLIRPFIDTGETVWLRFPIPWELGLMFKTLPERILEWMDTEDPEGLTETLSNTFWQQVTGTVLPIPTAVEPLVENWANYSFFLQRNIDPVFEEAEGRFIQRPGTSEVAKGLAAMLHRGRAYNIPGVEKLFGSPQKIDNMMWSYTGGLGRMMVDIADATGKQVGLFEKAEGRPPTMSDIPGIRGFVAREPMLNTESMQRFRRQWTDIRRTHATIRLLEREERWDQLEKEYEDPRVQEHMDLYPTFNRINSRISGLYAQANMVERDPDLSPEEKMEALREIGREATELARETIGRELPGDRPFFRRPGGR
jgi:adenylate kinase family enzyme